MNRFPSASPTRLLTALTTFSIGVSIVVGLTATIAGAQSAPAEKNASDQPAPTAQTKADLEWLSKTSKLYYSSAKAGLTGFDCAIHPDWQTVFATVGKDANVAADDPRIALLNSVKITVHAHMRGPSTIEWVADSNPDKPLSQESTDLLDGLHRSIEQTLEGFLQFWGPFFENTVVPDTTDGLEITHTPTVHTIRAKQGDTELTEVFSNDLVLEQFNVNMSGTSIKFVPTYQPSPQGLLVSAFDAHIRPAGSSPEQAQVMKVGIEYQPVGALMVPGKLKMEVVGTGVFNFVFDGCTTNAK